uniref:Protein masquerade clip-domain domain-containing protein n=1 Tax=Heliothis virescens TaxID=7102 RepID=A0A2A4K5J5_HELVI
MLYISDVTMTVARIMFLVTLAAAHPTATLRPGTSTSNAITSQATRTKFYSHAFTTTPVRRGTRGIFTEDNIACPGVCVALRIAQHCEAYIDNPGLCTRGKVCCVSPDKKSNAKGADEKKNAVKRPTKKGGILISATNKFSRTNNPTRGPNDVFRKPPPFPSSLLSGTTSSTIQKSGPQCSGDCVSKVLALFCNNVHEELACPGNKICCMTEPSTSTRRTTTTTLMPGPKCPGDCVSPVFSVSCNKLDEEAECSGNLRCCLDRAEQTENWKPHTRVPCRGYCVHMFMSDLCSNLDESASCEGANLCCLDEVVRNTTGPVTISPEKKCPGVCVDPIEEICNNVDGYAECPGMARCCLDQLDEPYTRPLITTSRPNRKCNGKCVDRFSSIFECKHLAVGAACSGTDGCCLDNYEKTTTELVITSTPSPGPPCRGHCVDPLEVHCYNQDRGAFCPHMKICCYDTYGRTPAKPFKPSRECKGDCISGLFSLLCDDVDQEAGCPGEGVCCLMQEKSSTTSTTTTTTATAWPPCPGQCIHGMMRASCVHPAVIIVGTECELEGWQCCDYTRMNEVNPVEIRSTS